MLFQVKKGGKWSLETESHHNIDENAWNIDGPDKILTNLQIPTTFTRHNV